MKPKKLLALVLSLAMIISTLPTFSLSAFAAETTTTEKTITLGTSALKGGQQSNVYFGRFQQSSLGKTAPTTGTEGIDWIKSDTAKHNNRGPYYRKDPIKWRVLSNANGKALLLSDKVLEQICFYDGISTRNGSSTIYRWMNGTGSFTSDNFIGSAFSESEKNVISGTSDKIFLLSTDEAKKSEYGFTDSASRGAYETDYTYGGGRNGNNSKFSSRYARWWLRISGGSSEYAPYVDGSGDVLASGTYLDYEFYNARPAFNLTLSSVLFTSAAKDGKPIEIGSLSAVSAYSGNDYKLTLSDSNRNFAVTDTTVKTMTIGESLSIDYTGATTGTNEYVSAIIVNSSNNEVVYYGQLAQSTTDSGTVVFKLPSDIEAGTYVLKLFNEQINGDYKTDFSSAFSDITLTVPAANVSFDANDGSGTIETKTIAQGVHTLPECSFTAPEGKIFYGWAESADGEIVKNTYTITKDTTFYAIWGDITEVKYTTDNGDSWNFDSLVNAISANSTDVEIKLLKNITLTSSEWTDALVFPHTSQNATIDGQGYTITRDSGVGTFIDMSNDNSTLTFKNITIDGGAVWSDNNPATRINTGYSTDGYYGLFYVYMGTLVLDDGAVIQNAHLTNETSYGGAIAISGYGAVMMNDGAEIKDCASGLGGGGVYIASPTASFTMNGGKITGCYATSAGGAVLAKGKFIMNGGEISNNASGNTGGAVTVSTDGVFTLVDGVIKNNASVSDGGAITILAANSIFNLNGGEISSNTTTGILVPNGTFNLSGSPVIKNNTSNGNASNVYLNSSKVINIDGELSNTEKIGVTVDAPSVFTSGWNTYMNGKSESNYFASDKSVGYIALSGTEVAIKENVSFTVTDTEQIYTGEAKNITVTLHSENTLKVDDFTVKYYKINENENKLESITAVTNAVSAGKYLYVIDFADSSNKDGYTIVNALDKELDTTSAVSDFSSYGNTGIFTIKTGITGQQTPIYFKDGTVNLKVGGEFTNVLTNENGTTPTFTSSNTDVVTVDSTGKVTAVGKGTATITAKSEKDETTPVYASYTVNVGLATKTLTAESFNVTAQDKVYDGTDEVKISAVLKGGVAYEGDNIKVDITGEFADVNAGESKTVNYKITGISGTGAENYVLENGIIESTTTANITKATVTIICATTTTRTFDGTAQKVDVSAMANGAVFDSSNYTVKYNDDDAPSAVGSYDIGVELTEEAAKNYTVTQPRATLIIKSASQEVFSIEGVPEAVYYGDSFTLSADGTNVGNVTYEITSGAEIAELDGDKVTVKGVGKVTITATSKMDGYNDKYATKTFNAKQKVLTPTATATDRTYNGENGVEVTISLKNIVNSDTITATGTGTMLNADAGENKIVYVSGITLDGDKKDLYTLDTSSVQTTVTIAKKEISAITVSASNKKYDGSATATATVETITGVIVADAGQVGVIGSAVFADANSEENKAVTFTASSLSGAKAANYYINGTLTAETTATISPVTVNFVVGQTSFVYDGNDKKITLSASDEFGRIFNEYTVEYNETPNAAGTYMATVVLNDSVNYTTTQGEIPVTISEATQDNLVIVGLPGTIQYGDSFELEAVGGEDSGTYEWTVKDNADVTLSATDTAASTVTIGDVVGDKVEIEVVKKTDNYEDISAKVVFVPTAKVVTFDISNLEQTYGEVTDVTVIPSDEDTTYNVTYNGSTLPENAGTYTVKVTATGNYTGMQTATLTIKKATATGTITGIDSSYTYGDTITGVDVTDLKADTEEKITYAGTGIDVPQIEAPTKVGNYTVIAEITGDNYETLTLTKNFEIEKATLTVKANNAERAYGEANPIFTLSYTGFVNGETKDVLLSEPVATVDANASSGVGEYKIKVSGGSAENYDFSYDDTGKLTVKAADGGSLYITGSTNTAYVNDVFTLHAFYGNSKVNVTWASSDSTIAEIAANGTVTAKKAGTVTITATADANYGNATATFELTVKQTGIILVPTGLVKTYTGEREDISFVETADFTPVLSGEGKNVDVTYTLISNPSVTEPIQVGTYSVVYTITDGSYTGGGNTTMYINKATVTAKVKNDNKIYGDEYSAYDLEITNYGTLAESIKTSTLDEIKALTTYASDGAAKTAVVKDGGYEIIPTLSKSETDNVIFTVEKGTLTVTKAPLTVKVKDVSREYGAENPTLEAEYTGFKNEENENTENIFTGELALAYDESITVETAVGEYADKTTASGIDSANYEITFAKGKVTITKIGVTASAGTSRSSYLTVKFDKAVEGVTFTVTDGTNPVEITEVTASSDNKTYTLKGSFSTSVTYTVTPTLTSETHEITSEALSIKPSSSGGGGGGGGGSSAPTTYTVKFETNGGSEIDSVKVTKNKTADEPTEPTRDGYTFDGWYTDKELTKAYDFDTKVTKAITLYAKWTENEVDNTDDKTDDKTDTPDTPVWENPFTDVKTDDWYYENARYAVENGLFNGTTKTTFAPNGIITRAMMVTVLYRAENEPTVTGTATFEDVDSNAYYAKAVVWGQQNGIIKGYSETEFAPDQNITREQIAAIMHRYAQYKGYDVHSGENTNILSYSDYDSISEYAIPSMQYAVGSGLMKGKTTSTLNPQDFATRAEIAAILNRFIEANK